MKMSKREEGRISEEYLLVVPFDLMGGGCTEVECPGTLFLLIVRNVAGEGNENAL